MFKELRQAFTETASTPEAWAKNFAQSTVMTERRAARMRRQASWALVTRVFPAGSYILDAGCGFGEWVHLLETGGYRAVGLDYSPELIRRLKDAYPHSTWIEGDIRSIPLPDDSVDGVISWGVIEHEEAGPAAALREFYRLVKPGGSIIVTVPHDSELLRVSSRRQFPPVESMKFFQYFMTEQELAGYVAEAGFVPTETDKLREASFALVSPELYCRLRGLPFRVANRLASILFRPFRRYHLMVYCIARKPLQDAQP
jgi:SAM-dependent methyltransferase